MLTAKPKSSRQIKKLAAKPKSSRQKQKHLWQKQKAHGKSKKLQRKGSWALIVHAKAVGDKSNVAASSSLSYQMFCSNCGAEAVPTANICTRFGQGNMLQVYFVYSRMGELMNTR